MRSVFSFFTARLMTSFTAVLGLGAVSACAPRTVTDVDRTPQQPIATPQPVAVQQPEPVFATTQAIGEEDSAYQSPPSQAVTTLAVGEEDGSGPFPVEPNGGIGGGAGPIPIDPLTQQQIGNVQGDFERVYIPPAPSQGQATTFAIGEEG